MINNLRYAVTFPTNGVSLNGEFSFQPGATAITGDNGAGKSFVAEMIRYGFFGKKALRGPASDYKTLDMEMSFLGHRVVRGKKEFLYDNDNEQLAVGADAVNKKIVELLGFDLEVFDVVCAANQKESERLTRLTPARRKELIDDVVGLTRQETVEKACKEEAKIARTEAETMARMLVAPVEPVRPQPYRSSADIRLELDETIETLALRAKLQRVIDGVGEAPVEPEKAPKDVEKLELHEKARVAQVAHLAAVERQLATMAEPTYTLEQIEQAEALADYDAEVRRRGPRSRYTDEQLDHFYDILDAQKLAGEEVTCPKCEHQFHPGLTEEQEKLAREDCPLTRREIDAECQAVRNWVDELVEPEGVRLHPSVIAGARLGHANAPLRVALQKEIDEIEQLEDKSAELVEARRLDREWDFYVRASEAHMAKVAAAHEAEVSLFDLPTPKRAPEDLNHAYTEARVYEDQHTNYVIAKERFDELTAEIGEKQKRAEAFLAGAKGLVEARRTLKAFLAPSLSRVATKIIREMTANALRTIDEIVVDEDMNITADGQDVSTFNGAHATMINLALRLALGQVLVARVLPLFIGDEIDSDATPANAQAIADGLMACKDQLKQIVLISHKRLENVDHEVML